MGNVFGDEFGTIPGQAGPAAPVIDNLASTSPTSALSANQGRVLNEGQIQNALDIANIDVSDCIEEFLADNQRFFGELGLPNLQGWTIDEQGTGTVEVETLQLNGEDLDFIKINDDFIDGASAVTRPLNAQNWVDINNFGAVYSGQSRLDTANGTQGFFSSLQDQVAVKRYGISIKSNGGFLSLTAPDAGDPLNLTLDGTGGTPLVLFDEDFLWEIVIPPGLGPADIYINGVLLPEQLLFAVNGGAPASKVNISSGSFVNGNRITYHANFGVTIFTESATKTLSAECMGSPLTQVLIPEGRRDYIIVVPDGFPQNAGDLIVLVTANIGGSITMRTEVIAVPVALFNNENSLTFEVFALGEVRFVNTVDAANNYKASLDEMDMPIVVVEDNLISTSPVNALSANQGRVLDETINALPGPVTVEDNLLSTSPINALSANQGLFLAQFPAFFRSGNVETTLNLNSPVGIPVPLFGNAISENGDFFTSAGLDALLIFPVADNLSYIRVAAHVGYAGPVDTQIALLLTKNNVTQFPGVFAGNAVSAIAPGAQVRGEWLLDVRTDPDQTVIEIGALQLGVNGVVTQGTDSSTFILEALRIL